MKKKRFNLRSFLSLGTFLFLIALAISGIVIHIKDHQPYTFTKVFCMTLHNISAVGFLAFSTGHIVKNWRAIKSYMKSSTRKFISKEMLLGIAIMAIAIMVCLAKAANLAKEHSLPF